MTPKPTNAKYLAQDILSRRDNSEYELRQKLGKKGVYGSELEETIAWLKAKKYLNDAATARHYIEGMLRTRAVGKRYLQHKLQQKRIAPDVIKEALNELLDETQEKALLKKAAAAWQRTHPKKADDKIRLSRFLLSRGFSGYFIQQQLESLENNWSRSTKSVNII